MCKEHEKTRDTHPEQTRDTHPEPSCQKATRSQGFPSTSKKLLPGVKHRVYQCREHNLNSQESLRIIDKDMQRFIQSLPLKTSMEMNKGEIKQIQYNTCVCKILTLQKWHKSITLFWHVLNYLAKANIIINITYDRTWTSQVIRWFWIHFPSPGDFESAKIKHRWTLNPLQPDSWSRHQLASKRLQVTSWLQRVRVLSLTVTTFKSSEFLGEISIGCQIPPLRSSRTLALDCNISKVLHFAMLYAPRMAFFIRIAICTTQLSSAKKTQHIKSKPWEPWGLTQTDKWIWPTVGFDFCFNHVFLSIF